MGQSLPAGEVREIMGRYDVEGRALVCVEGRDLCVSQRTEVAGAHATCPIELIGMSLAA